MQGGGVYFHHNAGGYLEGLYLRGIQLAVFDLALLRDEQDEIFNADVHLAVAVVFEAVQLRVVSPAHSELHRHSAEYAVAVFQIAGQIKFFDIADAKEPRPNPQKPLIKTADK